MAKISLSYPDTWLTISISVKNRDTWVEDFTGTMTEVGTTREYKYDFTEVVDTDYVYVATVTGYSPMSGVIYRDGWGLTTDESTHLLQLVNSTGGGGFINYEAINSHTTRKANELKDEISKIPKTDLSGINTKLNEINSHIDIAKTSVLDKIDTIETPEIDTTEIVKGLGVIKTQNTKLSTYLKSEQDKEKMEMETKHKKMMEDMEKAYAEMEEDNGKIVLEKDKEKESIMKDADEIIDAIENEKIEISEKNKSEIIDKIKTLI